MSFAVIHMAKFTRGDVRGLQSHIQREKESQTNPDVDYSRSDLNYDLINSENINFHRRISKIIDKNRTATKQVRKDAIVMTGFIISSDREFFNGLSDLSTKKFFEDALEWVKARYGADKVVSAAVHMDETTPHMHVSFVPLTADGRLSAKDLFKKSDLKELHTSFARDVGAKYDLERGNESSGAKHLSETRCKLTKTLEQLADMEIHTEELKRDLGALQSELERVAKKNKDLKAENSKLKKDNAEKLDYANKLGSDIKKLRTKYSDEKAEQDELFKIVAQKTLFGGVKIEGVTVEDIEKLKNTAYAYHEAREKWAKLSTDYERLEKTSEREHKELVDRRAENFRLGREVKDLREYVNDIERAISKLPIEVQKFIEREMNPPEDEHVQDRQHGHGWNMDR